MGQIAALALVALTVVMLAVLTCATIKFVPATFEDDHGDPAS